MNFVDAQSFAAGPADGRLAPGTWPVMLTAFDDDGRIDPAGMDGLIDWYLSQGAAGLFACCSSSEVERLTWDEKLQLTLQTVTRCANRAAVLGSAMGELGGRSLSDAVGEVGSLGVSGVVLNLSELAGEDEPDEAVRATLTALLKGVDPSIALGLYECPTPYHRLAGDELLAWAAGTGRFVFFKDTCCNATQLSRRLGRVSGTPMSIYNAHTPLMREGLAEGLAGFCGLGGNYYPAVYDRLQAAVAGGEDAVAERLQAFLDAHDRLIHRAYPRSAKVYLAESGVPVGPYCRRPVDGIDAEHRATLNELASTAASLLDAVNSQGAER